MAKNGSKIWNKMVKHQIPHWVCRSLVTVFPVHSEHKEAPFPELINPSGHWAHVVIFSDL